MTTLPEYISESILSSTHTDKAGLEAEMRRYGLDPAKVTFNADGTIDYDGNVTLQAKHLTKLPFKFGKVNGYFDISKNELITLEGCPHTVKSGFYCSFNNLTSLKDGPEYVGYDYGCSNNNLTSLEGLPKKLNSKLYCYYNPGQFTVEDVLAVCNISKNKIRV